MRYRVVFPFMVGSILWALPFVSPWGFPCDNTGPNEGFGGESLFLALLYMIFCITPPWEDLLSTHPLLGVPPPPPQTPPPHDCVLAILDHNITSQYSSTSTRVLYSSTRVLEYSEYSSTLSTTSRTRWRMPAAAWHTGTATRRTTRACAS